MTCVALAVCLAIIMAPAVAMGWLMEWAKGRWPSERDDLPEA